MEENLANVNPGMIEQFIEELPDKLMSTGSKLLVTLLLLFIGMQCIKIARKIVKKSLTRINADLGVVQFMDSLTKLSLYLILFLIIATRFGLNSGSLVAVLGSAGVAIGLSLQGSLSNFFGGVLILLLKPFKVGDYIKEDNKNNEGTVMEIQLFYTKLATPDDKVIVLPNGSLSNNSLTNFTATYKRRLDIKVGISYDSDLKKAKDLLEQMISEDPVPIKSMEQIVFVDELAVSSVILVARCWVLNEAYWTAKWFFTEKVKEIFDKNEIQIPFPQVQIHVNSE